MRDKGLSYTHWKKGGGLARSSEGEVGSASGPLGIPALWQEGVQMLGARNTANVLLLLHFTFYKASSEVWDCIIGWTQVVVLTAPNDRELNSIAGALLNPAWLPALWGPPYLWRAGHRTMGPTSRPASLRPKPLPQAQPTQPISVLSALT